MKKLLSTLKQKWSDYLIEIVVISVGILIAFTLSNWGERRKQNNQLHQYRKNLRIELAVDIETLEINQNNLARYKKSIVNYLDYYNSNNLDIDTLISKMDSIDYGLNRFNTAVYTIEDLIFSGNLSAFPGKEKSAVLKLKNTHENSEYYEREQIRDVLAMDYEKELDMLFVMGYATKEHSEVRNWKYNINSPLFRLNNNHIASVLGLLEWQDSIYKEIKKDTEALLDALID